MQEAALEAAPQNFLSPASPLLLAAPLPHLFNLFLSLAGLLPADLGLPGPARRAGPIIVSAGRAHAAGRRPGLTVPDSSEPVGPPGSPLPRARFRALLAPAAPVPLPGPGGFFASRLALSHPGMGPPVPRRAPPRRDCGFAHATVEALDRA